jgi:hypothetical protein
MTATARNHDFAEEPVPGGPVIDGSAAVGNAEGTEYATRGARAHRHSRPHLRIVTPLRPERASRGVFALVVSGLLAIGMILILVINTSLAQGAFTVRELAAERAVLSQQEQALSEEVAAAAAPRLLEERARSLGMVPSENPVFLSVPSGEVLGTPKPAEGRRTSVPRLLTPADATVTEAVDNAGADFPVSPGADYDPAAADAAAAQAQAASEAAAAAEATATTKAERRAERRAREQGAAAEPAKKKKPNENSLWQDSTVLDVTGDVSTGDAGLVAVPVD